MSEHDAMDLFGQACGATGPLQLRIEHPGSTTAECKRFDTPYVVIGRDPLSDLVLEHQDICPRHAYLQLIGGRLYCVDLGSQSSISLCGQSRRVGWVEPHQLIRIGPYRISLVIGDGGDSFEPGSHEGVESHALTLDLSHRGFKASECPIDEGLSLVGSSSDCQVRLIDPSVSNIHCSLVATRHGLWVVDLLGKGGIQVNEVSVRQRLLQPRDELRVGRSSIRVRQSVDAEVFERLFSAPSPGPEDELPEAVLAVFAPIPAPLASPVEEDPIEEPKLESASSWSPASSEFETETELERFVPVYNPARRRQIGEEQRLAAISAQERRASCRYPVAELEANLSWQEPIALPSAVREMLREDPKPSATEETMYGRVMARWPGSHNGGAAAARATAEMARGPLPPIEESVRTRSSTARILDISQTGLLVLSADPPPAHGRILLRLEDPEVTDWIEMDVRGATPATDGAYRLRLAFCKACPYDFFKAVLYKKPGS